MKVENKTHHSDEQWAALALEEDDGPVYMTNLLKFKPRAVYPDGRESNLSGLEAYQLYGAATGKQIAALGGRVIHSNIIGGLVAGEVEDLWDIVGIVEYPSLKAFMDMVDSDEYKANTIHREAGLAGQLLMHGRTPPT